MVNRACRSIFPANNLDFSHNSETSHALCTMKPSKEPIIIKNVENSENVENVENWENVEKRAYSKHQQFYGAIDVFGRLKSDSF